MKRDIENSEDIHQIIQSFYDLLIVDDKVKHFFEDVVKSGLKEHIDTVSHFWSNLLLGTTNYSGNPMSPHIQLNIKHKMQKVHFDQWLLLFERSIRNHFEGKKAEEMIDRARHIASIMFFKVSAG